MAVNLVQVWRQTSPVTHLPRVTSTLLRSRALRTVPLRLGVVSHHRQGQLRHGIVIGVVIDRLVIEVNIVVISSPLLLKLQLGEFDCISILLVLEVRVEMGGGIQRQHLGLLLMLLILKIIVVMMLLLYHFILVQCFRVIAAKI